jgi:hypothetical protein
MRTLSEVEAVSLAPRRRRQTDPVQERHDVTRRLLHGELAQILGAGARGGKQELSISHSVLKVSEIHWLAGARDYDVYVLCTFGRQPLGQTVGRDDVVIGENDDERCARRPPLLCDGCGGDSVIGFDRAIFVTNIDESSSRH